MKKLILAMFVLIFCGLASPAQANWEGVEVTGTVFSSDYPGYFDWPDPMATISFTDVEFIRTDVNVTITADFTEDMLILTYENTSGFPDVTLPPRTFTFALQGISISDVSPASSTFTHDIVSSFTLNSIILEVPLQNTNPNDIFTGIFEVVIDCTADFDSDGFSDCEDNCPSVFNPNQEDDDRDGIGNVCDTTDGAAIPTLSEWGMIIFMTIILGIGVVTLVRRKMV